MLNNNMNYLSYINSQIGIECEITESIQIDDLKFIFFQPKGYSNPFNDGRLKFTNNIGPLKVDINNGDYELMGAIQFLFEYGNRPEYLETVIEDELITYESIVSNAINRKHLNLDDFEEVINSITGNYSNGKMSTMLKRNFKEIILEIDSDNFKEIILKFLKETNAKYKEIQENIFEVFLDLN